MIAKNHSQNESFWLRTGRFLLFGYAALILLLGITGIFMSPSYARDHPEPFNPNNSWSLEQLYTGLQQLGWPAETPVYVSMVRSLVTLLVSITFGLLLLWRRPPGLFTLYLAFTFISFGAGVLEYEAVAAAIPGLQILVGFFDAATWQWFFLIFYFFPNGQAVPRWTRWPALAWLAFTFIEPFFDQQIMSRYAWVFIVLVLSAILSQVYRYFWRSDPVQRQQTKWILFLVLLFAIVVGAVAPFAFRTPVGDDYRIQLVIAFANYIIFSGLFLLFPVFVLLAVLRYRLWDIDLVIRRTLAYAVLTALLGLVYFGMVTLIQTLFVGASGQQSPLALVVSTLLIAALFNPLRRRIQQVIDRRFFRQKYDTEQALEEFSSAARREVELAKLTDNLANVVQKTIQPEQISVWLKKTSM